MGIREALKERVLVGDGAMGTLLLQYGLPLEGCLEQANLIRPDLVKRIHREYLAAGADLVETNTFGANRFRLSKFGLAQQVAAINRAGVELARAAVAAVDRPAFVVGAVGPLGRGLAPLGTLSPAEAEEAYLEQFQALVNAGVDLLLLETMADPAEVELAVRVAHTLAPEIPLACSLAFLPDEGKTLVGAEPQTALSRLGSLPLTLFGANCGSGPQDLYKVMSSLAAQTTLPLWVAPNAGRPQLVEGRSLYLSTPAYFAEYTRRFLELGAVRVIGGCCGTTPEHIAAMAAVIHATPPRAGKGVEPQAPSSGSTSGERPKEAAERIIIRESNLQLPTDEVPEETRWAPRAEDGGDHSPVPGGKERPGLLALFGQKTVLTVEIDPPKGVELSKVLAGARLLKEAGIDAVNIADSPMARVRMSPVALAHRLGEEVGIEAILHFTCRDRNLLGLQSELIGAAALGINNVLALTGDPPGIGDHPQATAVFDVNSEGLVKILHGLNEGHDLMGNSLGARTNFTIGVAVNPAAADLEKELARLEAKLAAGAHFIQTQPLFDVELWRRFAAELVARGIKVPVLLGILPLRSARHAEFLHNEVPGIEIPAPLRTRMAQTPPEEQAGEGIRIAQELVASLRGEVAGFYLMPPFGSYQTAVEVAKAVK